MSTAIAEHQATASYSYRLDAPLPLAPDTSVVCVSHYGLPDDALLVSSVSKAAFAIVPSRLAPVLRTIQAGGTVRDAINSLPAGRSGERLRDVRELVSHITLASLLRSSKRAPAPEPQRGLLFYTTLACNLRCRHCYVSAGKAIAHELTTPMRMRVIEDFASWAPGGEITFTGGEPLLVPEIGALVRHAKSLGLRVSVFTNGILLTGEMASQLAQHVDTIQISLDGLSATTNDRVRGQGTFDKILASIRLLDRVTSRDDNAMSYRIAITMTSANHAELSNSLVSFLDGLDLRGRRTVAIALISNAGRAKGSGLFAGIDELVDLHRELTERLAESGLLRVPEFVPNSPTLNCGFGETLTVCPDGQVLPCAVLSQPSLGSCTDCPLLSLLDCAANLARTTTVDSMQPCSTCELRYFCGGKCRVQNLHETGAFDRVECHSSDKARIVRLMMTHYRMLLHQYAPHLI